MELAKIILLCQFIITIYYNYLQVVILCHQRLIIPISSFSSGIVTRAQGEQIVRISSTHRTIP
jgi:hypothetical protein